MLECPSNFRLETIIADSPLVCLDSDDSDVYQT